MNNKYTKWKTYFENFCKQQLLKGIKLELDYGNCVYKSPILAKICWIVTEFHGEYNVFFERFESSTKSEKKLAASFGCKESAMEFALEMLLILSGHITRKGFA